MPSNAWEPIDIAIRLAKLHISGCISFSREMLINANSIFTGENGSLLFLVYSEQFLVEMYRFHSGGPIAIVLYYNIC